VLWNLSAIGRIPHDWFEGENRALVQDRPGAFAQVEGRATGDYLDTTRVVKS
jgi:hypothetical protein